MSTQGKYCAEWGTKFNVLTLFTGTIRLQESKCRSKGEKHALLLLPPNRFRRKSHRSLHSHLRPFDPDLRALFGKHHPPSIIRSRIGLHGSVCYYDFNDYGCQSRKRVYEHLRVSLTGRCVFGRSNANEYAAIVPSWWYFWATCNNNIQCRRLQVQNMDNRMIHNMKY